MREYALHVMARCGSRLLSGVGRAHAPAFGRRAGPAVFTLPHTHTSPSRAVTTTTVAWRAAAQQKPVDPTLADAPTGWLPATSVRTDLEVDAAWTPTGTGGYPEDWAAVNEAEWSSTKKVPSHLSPSLPISPSTSTAPRSHPPLRGLARPGLVPCGRSGRRLMIAHGVLVPDDCFDDSTSV
jgi:hypothetical protein